MITLNQKQLKAVMDLSATAGRLDELNRLEGYAPSATISKRKGILRKQLADMFDKEEPKEEKSVHIRIEIPEEEKKVKKEESFSLNLKKLLSGKFNEIEKDEDNEVILAIKNLLPREDRAVFGKIVNEL
jgi:hypothetical protein